MDPEELDVLSLIVQNRLVTVRYWVKKSRIANKNGSITERIGMFNGIHMRSSPLLLLKTGHMQLRISAHRIVEINRGLPVHTFLRPKIGATKGRRVRH